MSYPPYQGHGQPNPYQQYPTQYPPQQGHSPYPPQLHYQPPPMSHAPPAQPPLPPGWISQWDQASNRPFFVEQATGRTQWEPPAAHFAPPSPLPPHGGYAPPIGQQPPFGGPAHHVSYPPMGTGPPTPASPGYIVGQVPPTDLSGPATDLREAMKGFGTNEKKLIQVLSTVPDPQHMEKIRRTFSDLFRRDLIKDLSSETSSWFKEGLTAIARGPLLQDAYLVDRAIRGLGTKESILDEVCLGRSNADLTAVKHCYQQMFGKDMVKEIKDDLSLKTERLYEYVLSCRRAEESAPCLPHEIDQKVDRLQQAMEGANVGVNHDPVLQILAFSSDGQLRAINARYIEKYRTPLDDVLSRKFSGHMKHALRLMLSRAVDKVKSDADGMEEAMKGMGTKDELLVNRIVKAHWNREHMRQVKVAYTRFFHKSLADRVRGETSGDYQRLMVALIGP